MYISTLYMVHSKFRENKHFLWHAKDSFVFTHDFMGTKNVVRYTHIFFVIFYMFCNKFKTHFKTGSISSQVPKRHSRERALTG